MRVLVTNDDGIAAPGLRELATALIDAGLDVVVAAPRAEASGSSAALTAVTEDGRIGLDRHELRGADGVPAYGVAASPGYIVVLAGLGAFGPPPEVVFSGINRGANAGHAVLHSGTVGAALTAANSGRRAMAVSLDVLSPAAGSAGSGGAAIAALDLVDDETRHWRTAAGVAIGLLPALRAAPPGVVININVPDVPPERLRGIRRGSLADFGQVSMALAKSGEGFVRVTLEDSGGRHEPGTDLAWLANGYACVTPVYTLREAPEFEFELEPVSA